MFRSMNEVVEHEQRYIMPTYRRQPIVITEGTGARVKDITGREYIDCVGGIAVNAVGYSHPAVVKAIQAQAARLMHVSNLYYTEPQVALAEKLTALTGMAKAFFCNSGAESVEAALKLAGKQTGKSGFIAAEQAFHGRTLSTLSATYEQKYRRPFAPLLLKTVTFVPYNDAEAIRKAITEETAAVILEPIQGEGGIRIPAAGYLTEVREICTEHDVLLILDEVQTGFGRTGRWFGKDHDGVEPDIMTLAKAMGAGFPIGAMLAREGLEFGPGEHASTFGGNPLACATALASIQVIETEHLVERSHELGAYVLERAQSMLASCAVVREIRGKGLMIGLELTKPCADIVAKALERGVLINCTADTVIRLVPPLVIPRADLDAVIVLLSELIA